MKATKMEIIILIIFAVLVGMLLPIQAASNAGVSRFFGDVSYAVLLSFVIGIVLVSVYILVAKPSLNSDISQLSIPKYLVFGGLISVVYTIAITYLSPRLGVGNTLFIIIVGQMIAALLVDHFGVFESVKQEITLKRVAGVTLMLIGVYLARQKI